MIDGVLVQEPDGGQGSPVTIGRAFAGFREEVVKAEARQSVQASAVKVLDGALSSGPASTGLVVGRVQSGKTLSYEGVIALARDNGFAVVVVISGVSNPLLDQGEKRLRRDLTRSEETGWLFLSPADPLLPSGYVESELIRVRENWKDPSAPPAYKKTAVVFVLKNYSRIGDLATTFERVGLGDLSVLVVDDEADQASLNTLDRRSRESPVFANIRALRESLPNHYYLQYTATPQAPLLVAIQNALSPDFVRVLEPGHGYTGGETYFEDHTELTRVIAAEDIAAGENPHGPPPEALASALREFLVGAAHVAASGNPTTRSMLVHPARATASQACFAKWVRAMADSWYDKYEHASEVEPLKLRAEFEATWLDLRTTYPGIASFDDCWSALGLVFRNLDITEVNASGGKTPVIDWQSTKSYILVGGQAIDRGFTVEGLTVTYMPRGAGTLTADTIQQRARFFGYKSHYLGLCRVHLEPVVRDAFESYVHHERDMLRALSSIEAGSDSLKLWKRRFWLDPAMRPTRATVVGIDTIRVSTVDRWIVDKFPVREDGHRLDAAVAIADAVLEKAVWQLDEWGHKHARVTVGQALELLEKIAPDSYLGEEAAQALQLSLARLGDEDDTSLDVAVYRVRPHAVGRRLEREDGGGIELFEGRNKHYPGDRAVFDSDARVTVQLHQVEVFPRGSNVPLGSALTSAWKISENTGSSWLVQVGV